MVLSLPNVKGEAGVQDPAVGKHPSSVDVLLPCCLGGYLQHQAQKEQLGSLAVSPLSCGTCNRAVKPQQQLLLPDMQNPCRVLLSSLSLLTHDSCLGSLSQVPDDSYLTAPRVCQEKGLCLILLAFTFNQENIPSLCFIQPIPT